MVKRKSLKFYLVIQTLACVYLWWRIQWVNHGKIGRGKEFVKEKLERGIHPCVDILKDIEREWPNLPVQHLLQQNRDKNSIKLYILDTKTLNIGFYIILVPRKSSAK